MGRDNEFNLLSLNVRGIRTFENLEEDLKECAEKCDSDPNTKNLEELECLQTEYDSMYDYITQGAISGNLVRIRREK